MSDVVLGPPAFPWTSLLERPVVDAEPMSEATLRKGYKFIVTFVPDTLSVWVSHDRPDVVQFSGFRYLADGTLSTSQRGALRMPTLIGWPDWAYRVYYELRGAARARLS